MSINSCTSCASQQVYLYNYNERVMMERLDKQRLEQLRQEEKMRVLETTASTPSRHLLDMFV